MKKIAIMLLALTPFFAMAEEPKEETIIAVVLEDKYTWKLQLEQCHKEIDPDKELIVVKKKFPAQTVTVKQDRRQFRCQVKRLEVTIV